jgi:hypothetical protein
MTAFDYTGSEDDRIGRAAARPPAATARAATPRTKAGAQAAVDIVKTFAVLVLIAFGMLALRLLLSLPHGIVH